MKTLWIFGDSFSTSRNPKEHIAWSNLLADKLNAELKIIAEGGSSIGWLIYQSFLMKDNFKEDDYVIFQTSTLVRAFLNKNKPGMTEFWKDCPYWNSLDKKEKEGYIFHIMSIHDEEVLQQQIQLWVWGMDHYTRHLKSKPIISRGWDIGSLDIPNDWLLSNGFLLDASLDEFDNAREQSINWMLRVGGDPRENHFSRINHYKIADMYHEGLVNRTSPDFNKLDTKLYKTYSELGNENQLRGMIADGSFGKRWNKE